ncbi:MAG TPA: 23S rRNA (adenine(2503)-C(2))-methyltransferase RlmN [Myxococcales bacterium]|nr:23S rRNA (adenine(2503)-C(2))-methyltransferase RlmN [Deltaproteobacteria bacterium]MBU49677.1 23S rRNA (adenine(2503)-C(2))-methyltransferase RlmN [Deltaproteobacteria bacterium]HAA58112.1 23S rRNA (adenine(2503)-C(2))-methyltransferase RlmN [Myxococcales bacterium]|tara:strand:- start:11147 stop:12271 length:1125 start_codon:yes stop_codon:yes gene_type:complete
MQQDTTHTSDITTEKVNLLNFSREQMRDYFTSIGEKPFRADQIFQWIYQRDVYDFEEMTNISKKLRQKLAGIAEIKLLDIATHQRSKDGTQKILFRLADGNQIESVLIPTEKRNTLCISSQVGCALACRFCYTATMGPGRNLSIAEYMGQFLTSQQQLPKGQRITNVVFMGMGEPLVNFENLMNTLSIMTDHNGPGLGGRRLTVSTAGLCPQILELGKRSSARLAISLHATTDEQRDELMPINKRYNLATLLDTLKTFQDQQQTQRAAVTLEYTLIKDVNDSDEDAQRLSKMAKSLGAKVNIIPYNEHPGAPYERPSNNRVYRFHDLLHDRDVRVTKRTTRGDDISAACGQLAIQGGQKSKKRTDVPHHRRRTA